MNASLLLVADFANIDSGGKLNVIGVFNRISARTFPTVHPVMYLVVRLVAELGDFDVQHQLRVILQDQDEHAIWETPEITFAMQSPPDGSLGEFTPIIGIQNLQFEQPGRYFFRVLVDKDPKGTVPIEVVQIASEAQ